MNRNNDTLEQELNATRERLYEQTKDMTPTEQVAFFNNRGMEILRRHGIKAKIADVPIVRRPAQPQAQP
ncbi:MAG: hypothetical protein LBK75_04315 [Oscillospiraceae bacterium]|jgi:hypothetical protein|nr:hypothetical protein [Oscillospiraceae bacterium]